MAERASLVTPKAIEAASHPMTAVERPEAEESLQAAEPALLNAFKERLQDRLLHEMDMRAELHEEEAERVAAVIEDTLLSTLEASDG